MLDVRGTRPAWTRNGPRGTNRPTLLPAHGLTDSADTWNRVTRCPARSYDVVRFDARGHGSSDRSSDYRAEAHTRDLVGLARELRLDRPVVVGHSTGGVHATLAATRFPVRALALEDPAWPQVPEDDGKDVADSRRRVVQLASLSEAERQVVGRTRHPSWDAVDLEPWSAAQTRLDPDVVTWFDSWRTGNAWREQVSASTSRGCSSSATPTRPRWRSSRTWPPKPGRGGPSCGWLGPPARRTTSGETGSTPSWTC